MALIMNLPTKSAIVSLKKCAFIQYSPLALFFSGLVTYILLLVIFCLVNLSSEADGNIVFKPGRSSGPPESTADRCCINGVCCSSNSDVLISDS